MTGLRRYLVAGLLVWIPLGVTFVIIKFLVELVDRSLLWLPPRFQPEQLFGFAIPGLGVVLSALVVLGTGVIVANFFGRHLVGFWEQLLSRIPLVRSIYSVVKQVAATVLSGSGQSFNKVVLVEYPRRDAWTLAFVTGKAWPDIADKIGADDLVSIYVPTTPNPTSGFFLMVPRKDIRELDLSVDEGLKLILSTGVLTPDEVEAQTGKRLQP
jgi:uncharacterized membrane protein